MELGWLAEPLTPLRYSYSTQPIQLTQPNPPSQTYPTQLSLTILPKAIHPAYPTKLAKPNPTHKTKLPQLNSTNPAHPKKLCLQLLSNLQSGLNWYGYTMYR